MLRSKIVRSMLKTEMLIYHSKPNFDEKILFVRITYLENPKVRKMSAGFAWESKIPHFILAHDLFGIDIQIQYHCQLQKQVLISIASKLWTKIECGILLRIPTPFLHSITVLYTNL